MASNSKSIAKLGKRLSNQIWPTRSPSAAPSTTVRRTAHTSAYDKNLEDQVSPSVVPDDVIQPQSDKYWAPHPQTGVFGPAAELPPAGASVGDLGFHSLPVNGGQDSVLEEKAWFRPTSLEDLEKPHHP